MATWLSSRDLKDHPSDAPIRKALPVGDVQEIDDTRRIRWVISDGSVDRDNDTINPQGWDLAAYKQNPVVLWAHDPRQLPVAKATAIGVENGALVAEAAREEVRALKAKAREEARGTLDELRRKLRELSRASSITRAEATRESSGVASLAKRLEPEGPEPEDLSSGAQFEPCPGERVRIPKLKKTGVVIDRAKGNARARRGRQKAQAPGPGGPAARTRSRARQAGSRRGPRLGRGAE